MENKTGQQGETGALKSLDFVAWRIARAQKRFHKKEVDRQLSLRPRFRRENVTTH